MIYISNCNIWDNMFSQLKSPRYDLPNEFNVMLLKDSLNLMNISISQEFNSYKISLFKNPIQNFIKIKFPNLNLLPNNNNYLINQILNNRTDSSSIVDIYVKFSDGKIIMDYPENCTFINGTLLKQFTSKFLLVSYDLLTLFENKDLFYNYILMNPLNNFNNTAQLFKKTQELKFLELPEDNNNKNKILDIVNNYIVKVVLDELNKFGLLSNEKLSLKYSEDIQVHFQVDKKEEVLKILSLFYKGNNIINLDVKITQEKFNKNDFSPRSNNCIEYKPNI